MHMVSDGSFKSMQLWQGDPGSVGIGMSRLSGLKFVYDQKCLSSCETDSQNVHLSNRLLQSIRRVFIPDTSLQNSAKFSSWIRKTNIKDYCL